MNTYIVHYILLKTGEQEDMEVQSEHIEEIITEIEETMASIGNPVEKIWYDSL